MQENSLLQMQGFFFTVFMKCILIKATVVLILVHQGFACDQYHSVSGQIH